MRTRTRRTWAIGLVAAAVAVATWAVATSRSEPGDPPPKPATNAMDGMDMGGMAMGGDGSVRLTPAQIRTFGITFGTVEVRPLAAHVRTVGIVNFDETRLTAVTPRFGGFVERLHVNFTGQPVRRGQPLVEIYSPELVAAQEELLLAARLERDLAGRDMPGVPHGTSDLVAAARQRLRLWDISDAQIDRVLETNRAQRTLTLHAPAGGVVIEKNVLAGAAVQAGQALYTIADLSEIWVEAELREADAGLIDVGSAATIEVAALAGRPLHGRVEYVYPTLDGDARTLRARIAIRNPDGRLRPGMYATVRLDTPGRSALTVPAAALLDTGERRLVFVDLGDGRLLPQDVEVGRVAGGLAEILAGLEPGQRVVTSAQYLLDSESNLGDIMRSMVGMTGSSDMGDMDMRGGAMGDGGADMRGMTMPGKER